MDQDRELETLDAIYDALDTGDPAAALEMSRRALSDSGANDPVLYFLAGRALFELDRPGEAAVALERAAEIDPDDPEFHAYLGWAQFRAGQFRDADQEVARALELEERLPEAHYVRGLLLERGGETVRADRSFARAAELAPEWFPMPRRFTHDEFREQLDEARAALSESFRLHLDVITVIVEDLPSDSVLFEEDPPLDPEQTLGLFVGLALGERTSQSPGGELPPRIYLFKRNLERNASDADELAEQIRITLYHELGHYLGMDEDQLEDSGYA